MAPTEYRVIAKRTTIVPLPHTRSLVAVGEALNPEVLSAFARGDRPRIPDGYGQTETGQLTAMPFGRPARPGSMGRPLPGVDLTIEDGELCVAGSGDGPDVLRALPGGRRAARRTGRGGPVIASNRTRMAICALRAARTT